jgi:hypothetical protein
MQKAFEGVKVRNLYCGFVDVLGFGNVTLKDHQSAVEVYERFIEKFEIVASGFKLGDIKLNLYSDAFILLSEHIGHVIQAAHLLSWMMLMENFLVRGGIAYGPHVEVERGGTALMVSSALTRAVQLEKTVKKPCIVLADDIELPEEIWFLKRPPAPIVHYFDGLRIVSPFGLVWFRSAGLRARLLLEKYPEHADKYQWFLRLYNAVNSRELLMPPAIIEKYGVSVPENIEPILADDTGTNSDTQP